MQAAVAAAAAIESFCMTTNKEQESQESIPWFETWTEWQVETYATYFEANADVAANDFSQRLVYVARSVM